MNDVPAKPLPQALPMFATRLPPSQSRRPIVLVNSGAYTEPELAAEFGALPPAFLPVGLSRLYELQACMLAPLQGDMYLTLPASFELSDWDAERLADIGFTVIRTANALSLGGALLHTLGHLGFDDRPLHLLHGDTLVHSVDLALLDVAAVAHGSDGYRWAHVTCADGPLAPDRIATITKPNQLSPDTSPKRLCGYFAFASAARLAEKLALANGDFYDALNRYAGDPGLNAIEPPRWLDFGHVQTFFRSRRIVTTERAFNSLRISDTAVRKRSTDTRKLKAEARWLREVPGDVAPFCCRLLDEREDSEGYYYDSEYEYMPTLAELYVFGCVTLPAWTRIFDSCAGFIDAAVGAAVGAAGGQPVEGLLRRLVIDKTAQRLETFARDATLDLDAPLTLNGAPAPSLNTCLLDIEQALQGCGDAPAVMHGDFCFSNILFSFRTERVRLIDPRGLTENGEFNLHGDRRYDLAKLMHSVCGRYDLIVAGHFAGQRTSAHAFELTFPCDPWRQTVEDLARSLTMGGVPLGSRVVWAAMTSLFLSMPSLHADHPQRQAAFIANALRLHRAMEHAS